MKKLAGVIALALAVAAPGAAQDDLNIINDPDNPQVTGASARLRDDAKVQGGKALRVAVRQKGVNPWDVALQTAIGKPVKAGDNLLLAFWARLETGENGTTSTTLPYNAVQLSSAPYTALFTAPATIDGEWKLHEVRGKADRDYAAGQLNASIHLATARQTVDLGPVFVVDLGQ